MSCAGALFISSYIISLWSPPLNCAPSDPASCYASCYMLSRNLPHHQGDQVHSYLIRRKHLSKPVDIPNLLLLSPFPMHPLYPLSAACMLQVFLLAAMD